MAEDADRSANDRRVERELARIREAHRYGIVLLLVLVLFVFADVSSTAPWTGSVIVLLQALTLAVALSTSARRDVRFGVRAVLLTAAVVAVVQLELDHGKPLSAGMALFSASLTVATAVVVALGVTRQDEVNAASVYGAIAIYMLIGMLFVFVYAATAALDPPFFVQSASQTRSLLLYFSYITMATVGYGDYTAADQVGRTFAVIEALFGQLYLVTVVAVLVSRFGRRKDRV
jgi:Ion channel